MVRGNISELEIVVGLVVSPPKTRVLAISGSLRRQSSNTALIGAARRLAPETVELSVYSSLGSLPHFNPDDDGADVPEPVNEFRAMLQDSDAVLISSPEYAHGVPGALKNALDWVVGSGELIGKPVALINASARATHAWASLAETVTVMSARLVREASITIPLDGRPPDADAIAHDPNLSSALRSAIELLASAARQPA
jgi:chromate reductase, NAD(P)H dehydrogenase (quinone)